MERYQINKLKKIRLQNELSQTKLASILGVNQSTLSRWEAPGQSPPAYIFEKLAQLFKINNSDALASSFLLFIKHAKTSLTVLDEDFNIIEVSAGLLKKRNYNYSQALNLKFLDYLSDDAITKIEKALSMGLLSNVNFIVGFDTLMKTVDGDLIHLNIQLTPILGLSDTPFILFESNDISHLEFSQSRFDIKYR